MVGAEDQAEGFGCRSQRHAVGDLEPEDQRDRKGAIGNSSGPPPEGWNGLSAGAHEALAGNSGLLASDGIDHVDASLTQVKECKFYCDGATTALQQRVRLYPAVNVVAVEAGGRFETMRPLAPPAGRGYEYLTGTGWDFPAELAELPALLAAKLAAPSVQAGHSDLVIDPR